MQGIEESPKTIYVESLSKDDLREIQFEKRDQIDVFINLHFGNSRNSMDRVTSIRNEYLDLRLGYSTLDGGRAGVTVHNVEANNVIVIEDDDDVIPTPSLLRASAHNEVVFSASSFFPKHGKGISRRTIQMPATNEPDLELHVGIGRFGAGFSLGVGIGGSLRRQEHPQAPSNSTTNIHDDCDEHLCHACKRRKFEPTSGQSHNMSAPVQANRLSITCPVCLDSVKEESSTICGHIFCRGCIVSAIQTTKKCPTCRKKLTTNGFHRIFLPSSSE